MEPNGQLILLDKFDIASITGSKDRIIDTMLSYIKKCISVRPDDPIDNDDILIAILTNYIKNNITLDNINMSSQLPLPTPDSRTRYAREFDEICKINDGGFGSVFKTRHKLDAMIYAIKKISIKNIGIYPNNRYINEVRILARLSHPHIIRYYSTWIEQPDHNIDDSNISNGKTYDDAELDIGNYIEFEGSNNDLSNSSSSSNSSNSSSSSNSSNSTESSNQSNQSNLSGQLMKYNNSDNIGTIYIQMELCPFTLKEYIINPNIDHSPDIMFRHIVSILDAINYLHSEKIIHMDLTLSNILIDSNNMVKICDFGLAEYLGNSDKDYVIKDGTYGVLLYNAPESIHMHKYSYRTDIYSIGIILFELLNRFKTDMERVNMIDKFKRKQVKCKYDSILYRMIDDDEMKRPLINEMFEMFKIGR